MNKPTMEQRSQKLIKSAVSKVLNNISIIAIFVALGIVCLCYAGFTFKITAEIVISVVVPSVVLAISSLVVYELWVKNGIRSAEDDSNYVTLISEYDKKSRNINSDVMQEFIEAEKKRRYDIEEKKWQSEIEKIEKIIKHITDVKSNKLRLQILKRRLARMQRLKDNIIIDMPYNYSEQFDQLRYNTGVLQYKEYKPNEASRYMRGKRTRKYTFLLLTTLIGFNGITPTIGGQHWFIALFLTAMSAITLLLSVVTGFTHGYNSIAVSSTGVYKTALSFIDKADAYCTKYNKQLRYITAAEISEIPNELKTETSIEPSIKLETSQEIKRTDSQITEDIFNNLLK